MQAKLSEIFSDTKIRQEGIRFLKFRQQTASDQECSLVHLNWKKREVGIIIIPNDLLLENGEKCTNAERECATVGEKIYVTINICLNYGANADSEANNIATARIKTWPIKSPQNTNKTEWFSCFRFLNGNKIGFQASSNQTIIDKRQ